MKKEKPSTSKPEPVKISFRVRGQPVPQGSMKAFVNRKTGHAMVTHNHGGALITWRTTIAMQAEIAMAGIPPIEGPVSISINFELARPKSVSEKKRPYPTCSPDLDKLVRAVLDALTRICYLDDAQVVNIVAFKRYGPEQPGVDITVNEL